MSRVDIAQAEALEAEALDFPEERGEILLQAAEAWQRAGRPERAREILAGLLDLGGDDACYAQVQLAELDFSAGAAEAARARLATLAKDRALDETHCVLAAELLAEHGDLVQAARWYDRAAARFAEDEMDALRGYGGDVSLATVMVLRGASSLVVVPAQVAALTAFADQAGGAPTDTEVRRRYCESVPERDTIDWPPERNAACWCGSGHKYKKCCGRPG